MSLECSKDTRVAVALPLILSWISISKQLSNFPTIRRVVAPALVRVADYGAKVIENVLTNTHVRITDSFISSPVLYLHLKLR